RRPPHGGRGLKLSFWVGVQNLNLVVMVALSVTENHKMRYAKMVSVPNLKGVTVGKIASKSIREGSVIESDNASSYKKPLTDKYFHKFKTYDAKDYDRKELHIVISNMKRMIAGTYFSVSPKHIDLYLAEYCYRFNRRVVGEIGFLNLMSAMVK
ncbi:ISXO2-like transposase domain-containing protein, partial [Ruminococcus sp. YE71]|uniref:IS1595 family transposase n=2 Tax=unclassified Ruminococcus TaxID=2608920 RepID=UPI0009091C7B